MLLSPSNISTHTVQLDIPGDQILPQNQNQQVTAHGGSGTWKVAGVCKCDDSDRELHVDNDVDVPAAWKESSIHCGELTQAELQLVTDI